ncbi:MAG: hypothetical protein JJU42_12725 [Rhodobacteraceae bacterium]|nr:hypothetical protein [Paracoccaceae bacterium]
MSPRVIAIVILVVVVGFIGTMASVQYFVRDPLPIIGANQMLHKRTRAIDPPIALQIAIDGGYRVDVQFQHPGNAPPEVSLRPTDGSAITLDMQSTSDTHMVANGQLTRPGRWDLTVSAPGVSETFQFIVRE